MKALGADIVRFFNSEWPEDWYVDDSTMSVDGERIVTDENSKEMPITEMYELSDFGFLCGAKVSLETFYSRWEKAQKTVMLLVKVPKEKEKDFRDILKLGGYKIQGDAK